MSRANLLVKVGSYTGTGVAQQITDVGFEPQLVIVKGGSNHAVFRTRLMRADLSAYLSTNLANLSGAITGLTNSGFVVGTDVTANQNTTTYYYLALRGNEAQRYFRILRYLGTGADNRDLTTAGLLFQPDILHVKQDGANFAASRIAAEVGDLAFHLNGNAEASNEIQNFQANGFQLGTSTRTNGSGTEYYGFALKHLSGFVTSGSYVGNGTAQTISGLGFQPDWIILANISALTAAMFKTSAMAANSSAVVNNFGTVTTGITAITTDGFTVGTTAAANGSGNTIYYLAGKAGSFAAPITRAAV